MAVEVALDSPLAKQLQNDVHLKAVDQGWAGLDDSGLSEYIVLMLVNGKSQDQVASELSTDLLDVSPDDPAVGEFTRWLFEQVNLLSQQQNGSAPPTGAPVQQQPADHGDAEMQGAADHSSEAVADSQDAAANGAIPTGPKSMRDGGNRGRGGRMGMTGNGNRASNRPGDGGMHRIKGAANRINSHNNNNSPRGQAPKGPRGNMRQNAPSSRMQNAMQSQLNSMGGQGSGITPFSPEQQMQMLAMQQQMMAQFMTPDQQQAFMASMGMPTGNMGRQNGHFNKRHNGGFKQNGDTDAMDLTSSMDATDGSQPSRPDPSTTLCRFNAYCTKPDCPFVHQSPAAPPDTSVDMNDTCSFGAACVNRKCVGKHPSPAKRLEHAAVAQCRYWPNCTNPYCTFMHPSTPLCRNGADCKTPDCKFAHQTIECKFNPCLNPHCTYKHAEGQKRGKFQDKVWVNPESGDSQDHVSERKFVDENAKEETLLPGQSQEMEAVKPEEVKTEDMAEAT